jgi:hypothetical protein
MKKLKRKHTLSLIILFSAQFITLLLEILLDKVIDVKSVLKCYKHESKFECFFFFFFK